VDYFFNECSREEFSYFPFNCLTLVVSKPSQALLFGHGLWVYIQTMLDQFPGHPWHVRWFPREYVSVSPKLAPMTVVLDESPSWSWIDLRATSSVDWMLDLLAFLEGISSPD
jgi:hypothetical protein